MAKKMAKDENGQLEFPVNYGNLNIGAKTCKISVSVNRLRRPGDDGLTIAQAESNLLEKRLNGKLVAKFNRKDSPDQGQLGGMEDDLEFDGTFDVKSIAVKGTSVGFSLTFAKESIDVAEISHFAKKPGRIVILSAEEIPAAQSKKGVKEDDDDEGDDDDDAE